MELNNIWSISEDDLFFRFYGHFQVASKEVEEKLLDLNLGLHNLTKRYELLMSLSPDYCAKFEIDYISHYHDFLSTQPKTEILPINGYEFYKRFDSRMSKISFLSKSGKVNSEYVHAIDNYNGQVGLVKAPLLKNEEINLTKVVDAIPLYFYGGKPKLIDDNDAYAFNFYIESYSNIWKDVISSYKIYSDKFNKVNFSNLNNRTLAYYNTPRLNSFFREIDKLLKDFGGSCSIQIETDFYIESKILRKGDLLGIPIDGKIIYQEDIDEGRISIEDIL